METGKQIFFTNNKIKYKKILLHYFAILRTFCICQKSPINIISESIGKVGHTFTIYSNNLIIAIGYLSTFILSN